MDQPTRNEKAALLLLSLGSEVAESVLAEFGPDQQQLLRGHMLRQKQSAPSQETLAEVIRDFEGFVGVQKRHKQEMAQSEDVMEQLVRDFEEALPEKAAKPTAPEPPTDSQPAPDLGDDSSDPLAVLAQIDIERLASALQGESARAVSMVVSCLSTERAVGVLKLLPTKMRCQVVVYLGLKSTTDQELVPRIARAIIQKCRSAAGSVATPQTDEARYIKTAELLRMMEEPDRTQVLTTIAQHDKKVAASIRDYLYYFEDIIYIEDRSLQKILSGLDPMHLATALKGASQPIIDKVMQNVSTRVQESLVEEMELLGAVPSAQVEKARGEIVDIIQRLDQAGELATTRKRG